jgi:hypothetical protein
MRLIAFITALVGLALMAFGLWGLEAPQKVGAAVNVMQKQFFSVSRAATSTVHDAIAEELKQPEERKGIVPVQDPNFVPVTIEEKYSKYLYCMTSDTPCPGFSVESESAYYNDLREQMRRELQDYYNYLVANPLKIQKADEEFARKLLDESAPDIQIIGIKVIGLFPASNENLAVMGKVLKATRDDGVMNAGLDALQKYRNDKNYEGQIAQILTQQIGRGASDFTSVMTAHRAFPFINQDTVGDFRKLQKDMQYMNSHYSGLQEDRLQALNSALREYERDHLLRR